MAMYYSALAEELMDDRATIERDPALRQILTHSNGEMMALRYLTVHGEQSMPKEICEDMLVSSARMAALLKHMESKGWITRSDDPSDGRRTIVRLLPEGREHFENSRGALVSSVSTILEAMGPDDAAEYVRLHKKLLNIIPEMQRRHYG